MKEPGLPLSLKPVPAANGPSFDMAITATNLSFAYGHLRVFDNLSLEFPPAISFGLLGPNGSGKTTLIRLLVGLLKPSGGSIHYHGLPFSTSQAYNIGYMPQLPALYSELTVEQNIDFFARIYGVRAKYRRGRVEEVIKLIDLWPRRSTSVLKLSGGMKQRVSLGCAIVHKPAILILDEPTVGLDPELRARFWQHFENLTSTGTTLIISSHTMDDAAHCQKLAFLRQGQVIALGSPEDLKETTGNSSASLEDAFLFFIHQREVAVH